jgi:hypothetical protein
VGDGPVGEDERVVALALVTARELKALGPDFDRAFAIQEVPCSKRLLSAIDEADRQFWRDQDKLALS